MWVCGRVCGFACGSRYCFVGCNVLTEDPEGLGFRVGSVSWVAVQYTGSGGLLFWLFIVLVSSLSLLSLPSSLHSSLSSSSRPESTSFTALAKKGPFLLPILIVSRANNIIHDGKVVV